MGLRAIIQDHRGRLVATSTVGCQCCPVSVINGALALIEGLQLVISLGGGSVEVESDSLVLVSDVNAKVDAFDNYGFLLLDIWELFSLAYVISFSYLSQDCNSITHSLAHFGTSLSSSLRRVGEAPPFICSLIPGGFLSQLQKLFSFKKKKKYKVIQSSYTKKIYQLGPLCLLKNKNGCRLLFQDSIRA